MIFRSSITFRPRCVTEFSCVLIEATLNENYNIPHNFQNYSLRVSIIIHVIYCKTICPNDYTRVK